MRGFRIGSIFGLDIRIDLSWFIIFFLILWTLSSSIFPRNYPQLSSTTHIIMGVVGTLLFFTSLLIHELSHSLVAKAKGIPVEGITLFIFGGISQTRMEAETPGDEFQIAAVGPLASIVLAIIFWLVEGIGSQMGWSVAITGVALYLAYINIILAIFNLMPGFPLDGGRLFRALVWKITVNHKKATRVASASGKLFGYFIIAIGFMFILQANFLNGIWLVFIGWFLSTVAELSYQQQLLNAGLESVKAKQAMTSNPETVSAQLTLQELVDRFFMRRRYQAFPVIDNAHPIGVISLDRVKEVPKEEWINLTVTEAMAPLSEQIVVRPEARMSDVLQKMHDSDLGRVLVINRSGALEGIITSSDITGWLRRIRDFEDWKLQKN